MLLDRDQDERISFEEMVPFLNHLLNIMKGMHKPKPMNSVEELLKNEKLLHLIALKIFRKRDTDCNGVWDLNELKKFYADMAEAFNIPINLKGIEKTLSRADVNEDGALQFEEIKPRIISMLKRLIKKGVIQIDDTQALE